MDGHAFAERGNIAEGKFHFFNVEKFLGRSGEDIKQAVGNTEPRFRKESEQDV